MARPLNATTDPRADEIRAALADHPNQTDRQIATLLGINRWSRVTRQREHLAADLTPALAAAPPEPVALLADDVPAASDVPTRQLVIAANPTVICLNCSRPGTPSPHHPTWCKACASSSEAARWRETQLWACTCGRPFTRSTTQPERCIRCTGEYDQAAQRHRTGAIFASAD